MAFNKSKFDGEIGEQLYIDFLKDNNIDFIDVRNDDLCQWLDIDFIIPKNNSTKQDVLEHIKNGNPNNRINRQQNIGYTVEVKLDKVTHNRIKKNNGEIINGTGNLVYEIISHNMPGCLARSYADFVLYICVDTFQKNTILKKAYLINLYKWRKAMVETGKENQQNLQLKPLVKVKEQGVWTDEYIMNILHPVENLLKIENTVIDYTDKLKKYFPKNLEMSK